MESASPLVGRLAYARHTLGMVKSLVSERTPPEVLMLVAAVEKSLAALERSILTKDYSTIEQTDRALALLLANMRTLYKLYPDP